MAFASRTLDRFTSMKSSGSALPLYAPTVFPARLSSKSAQVPPEIRPSHARLPITPDGFSSLRCPPFSS
jgi:hypothetical protein